MSKWDNFSAANSDANMLIELCILQKGIYYIKGF